MSTFGDYINGELERWNRISETISFICDNIYLSGIQYKPEDILSNNIQYIINVTPDFKKPDNISETNYFQFSIDDEPNVKILNYLNTSNQIIEKAQKENKNILIHCHMGVSRSSSIIIGYLIMNKGMTYKQAFDLVKSKRVWIDPNIGFVNQLLSLPSN
jgi:protein-tyrosine phosphatase